MSNAKSIVRYQTRGARTFKKISCHYRTKNIRSIICSAFLLAWFITPKNACASPHEECLAAIPAEMIQAKRMYLPEHQRDLIKDQAEKLCVEKENLREYKRKLDDLTNSIKADVDTYSKQSCNSAESNDDGLECLRRNSQEGIIDSKKLELSALILKVIEKEVLISDLQSIHENTKKKEKPSIPLSSQEIRRRSEIAVAKVKGALLEAMKDPESTRFRNITVSTDGSFVCGEVNSKNSYGGYIGFKRFANSSFGAKFIIDDGEHDLIFKSCSENMAYPLKAR